MAAASVATLPHPPQTNAVPMPSPDSRPCPVSDALPRCPLDSLALRAPAVVQQVVAPPAMPDWADWLAEIGFLPGEAVQVIAHAPGGDPLVVRIGDSTFALRKAETACIHVLPQAGEGAP